MPPLSPEAFVRALRGLTRREFAAFVSDLWAARGYETTIEGAVVLAERGGDRLRLGVSHDAGWLARFAGGPPADDVDAVVTSGRGDVGGAARTIDAAELREVALYAVDRAECERLFRRHLGRPPTATGPRRLPPVAVVVAVLVVAAAAVALAGAAGFAPSAAPSSNATGTPPTPTPPPTEATATPAVELSGFESAERLASAHETALEGRSRFWSVTFEASRDGLTVTRRRQSVWMEDETVYRSHTEWWSREGIGPEYSGNATVYADGRVALERFREGRATIFSRLPLDGRSPALADRPASLVRRYLAVDGRRVVTTAIIDGALGYRVVARGTLPDGRRDATVTAEFTRSGVVRRLTAAYPAVGAGHIVVTLRVDGIGATSARPPPWLERARDETGGR